MGDQKKEIFILLIIIAIFSGILIIRMTLTPKYNPELYDEIYAEYENMMQTAEETETNEANVVNTAKKKKTTTTTTESNTTTNAYSSNGRYKVVGEIMIPKIKIAYPIINETTEENLKIAPTKLKGPNMNEVGNFCIAGHNYKNNEFFSKLSTMDINDTISLTSNDGRKLNYSIYKKYEVNENDMSCTDQDTGGKIEATLITCTSEKSKRLIIKCRAII